MPAVYVVEDDESIRELILYALESGGFDVSGFPESGAMWPAVESAAPDLFLLDIMLPGEDGLKILARLKARHEWRGIPVILLTAKSTEYDKVRGLDLGADDYITKPFGVMELLSRVRAVLRRADKGAQGQTVFSYEGVSLDTRRHVVTSGGEVCPLTNKEFELLHYMLKNIDIVLSRDALMENVWGFDYSGESRTVDIHIKSLRQKLGSQGSIIKTIRSVGYKVGK